MKIYKSEKIKQKALKNMDWEKRIAIIMLKNQGVTNREIAKRFDLSTQRVYQILKTMEGKTIAQMEKMYYNYLLTSQK